RDMLGGAPGQWPWWQTSMMVVAYLLSFDFCYYWFHRAQHAWPFLWRFHRLHHSDISISSTSSFRHHWMEETFRYFVIAIPLYMLFGRPTEYAPFIGLTIGAFGLFIHANIRLDMGPLTHVIIGPRYHRMHHSIAETEINRNFATFFPIWDRVFGTQALPRKNENPDTGIATDRKPNGILQILPVPPLHS
ncbi:MAG: sterol desaturase family protein, partial [Ramlibacter sp.]